MNKLNSGLNEAYKASLETSKWRFETQGLRASDRAYEYGVLVVKNAMLVSGGGLFFIPTMVGLSAEISIHWAFTSGMLFGACVLLTLVANYLIHWNWLLLEQSWEQIFEIEKISARKVFERPYPSDEEELSRLEYKLKKTGRNITRLFYGPHILAAVFVLLFGYAAFCLYQAFFSVIGSTP